jgi:peptide-methionine (S)-S-oxide reductase
VSRLCHPSVTVVNFLRRQVELPSPEGALPGRPEPMSGLGPHRVFGTTLTPPFPEGTEQAVFGLGCFWGADRPF